LKNLVLIFIISPLIAIGQDIPTTDSLQEKSASWGSFTFHARNFFMATTNQGNLSDYFANGIGVGLRYKSPVWKNFHGVIGGFYSCNIGSSDFSTPDPTTGQFNRYEVGLFDLEDVTNRYKLGRLEEFYLEYGRAGSFIRAGKMVLKTPFINPQDGRMRPTFEEGIWTQFKTNKLTLNAGWLFNISPRSTVKWYRVERTIGIYPVGVDIDGNKSTYFGNLESNGVFIAGFDYQGKNWSLQGWDTWIENINNTLFLKMEVTPKIENVQLLSGVQLIRQDAHRDGGNADQDKTYMARGTFTNIISTMLGLKTKKAHVKLNYTHISDDGRFLFPREWGRDPFYTFLPRERNEGFGGVNAIMVQALYSPSKNLSGGVGYGHYYLPDVMNFQLNKYGFPSYSQTNFEIDYQFSGFLKNLSSQLLIVYKKSIGETYENPQYIFNKVDMVNFNFVLNYTISK
jgi:hypothetical protein